MPQGSKRTSSDRFLNQRVPTPFSLAFCGLLRAVSNTRSIPLALPVLRGWKATINWHDWPGFRTEGQFSLRTVKLELMLQPEIVTVPSPSNSVIVCGDDV
jgi:hypothetical protein